jgi:outer membrane lipoprotein-sorting protein
MTKPITMVASARYTSATLNDVSSALRRLSLSRLLLLCGVVLAVGVGATALALAVSDGPVPPPKPLAGAIHDALTAPPAQGLSARIELTDRLVEGSSLTSGEGEASQLASSPLLSGGSGRLWIGSDGRARLELQSERGDTQILWDGHTASLYDASTDTLYRYVPHQQTGSASSTQDQAGASQEGAPGQGDRKAPTVAEIQEAIDRASKHAVVSEATPTDVAGQPAYTVHLAPREDGGLVAGAELSFDAVHGVPLRAAVYSTDSSSPVLELAANEISYGPVDASTLDFTPPASATIKDVTLPDRQGAEGSSQSGDSSSKPRLAVHGKGLGAIVVAESTPSSGSQQGGSQVEGLRKVDINGVKASELPTALGTVLSFERAGVRYLLAGSVTPAAIEAFARGL